MTYTNILKFILQLKFFDKNQVYLYIFLIIIIKNIFVIIKKLNLIVNINIDIYFFKFYLN